MYDPSSKNPIQLVLTCLKSDQGTYYLVDKYRVSAWLVLRVRCHLTYPAVTREYFKKDGITYDGLRVTDPDWYPTVGFQISKHMANSRGVNVTVFNGTKIDLHEYNWKAEFNKRDL